MRQFPFGTSENPETPKSLLRSGREDISNHLIKNLWSVWFLTYNTPKRFTVQLLSKTYNPKTKWTAQRIRKQPCGTIITEQKTGIIWSLLAVGMTKMVLRLVLLSVSNPNSNHQFNTILFHKAKKKMAAYCRELWAWLSRAIHETAGTPWLPGPWDVRWSTESFQASSPWFPADSAQQRGGLQVMGIRQALKPVEKRQKRYGCV